MKTFPKLKAHAAEVRNLIPIARDLAELMLGDADPMDHTVKQAMFELSSCYNCLSHEYTDAEDLKDHSRRFASLYVALEERSKVFGIRPKLHLFHELCEEIMDSKPAAHWTYRDEDFGGTIVALARSRGGQVNPKTVGNRALRNFLARHKVPWM